MWGEALIVFCVEGLLVKACDCSVFVELYIILGDMMSVLHGKVVKLVCSRGDWVGFTESCFQGFFKSLPTHGEIWKFIII